MNSTITSGRLKNATILVFVDQAFASTTSTINKLHKYDLFIAIDILESVSKFNNRDGDWGLDLLQNRLYDYFFRLGSLVTWHNVIIAVI